MRLVHVGDPMPMPRARARIAGSPGRQWVQHYTPAAAELRKREIAGLWTAAPFGAEIPLALEARFVFARPAGHCGGSGEVKPRYLRARPGKGGNKNADGRRTGADLDNLAKLVLDAINGVAFADDGQIVEIIAEKLFCDQAGVAEPETAVEIAPAGQRGPLLAEVAA